jgi:DNA-binding transcriptional MerR regulator
MTTTVGKSTAAGPRGGAVGAGGAVGSGGERLRIDELAHRSGIASGTIRFYQREGLIPPPERIGRVAFYGAGHLQRLQRIRALQAQGLPLAVIGDLLAREDAGQDISAWLELDRAVFGRQPGEALERVTGQLAARLRAMGVPEPAVAGGLERVSERLRAVAEEISELGWRLFAPDRQRLASGSDDTVAEEVRARFEELRAAAERLVAVLFPRLLEEEIRARSERYAVTLAGRRRRGRRP